MKPLSYVRFLKAFAGCLRDEERIGRVQGRRDNCLNKSKRLFKKFKHEEEQGILLFSSDKKNFVRVQEVYHEMIGGYVISFMFFRPLKVHMIRSGQIVSKRDSDKRLTKSKRLLNKLKQRSSIRVFQLLGNKLIYF